MSAASQQPQRRRGRRRPSVDRRLLLVLTLVPVLLYLRTSGFDFVRADDTDLIVRNQPFISNLGNIPAAFGRSYFEVEGELTDLKTYYRPLVIVSLMVDAQLGGVDPTVYHVTNVLMHACVVLVLFTLLMRTGARRGAAFTCAWLFAVHPLNVQAVCWIVGRSELMLAAFSLLSMIGLVGYVSTRRGSALVLHLTAFALALFTKETAVALLPVYGLFVWLWAEQPRVYVRHRILPIGYGVITVAWYALRVRALSGGVGPDGLAEYASAVVTNLPGLLLQAGKVLFPFRLHIMPSVDLVGVLAGVVAVGVLAAALGRSLPFGRQTFVWGWFVLFFAPTLLVADLPVYEHRAYVPLLGLAIGTSQLDIPQVFTRGRRRAQVGAMVVVAVFVALSVRHMGTFADRFIYWQSATHGTSYAPIALVNLGLMHEEEGRLDQAESHYREALAIDPGTPKANNNLGVVLMARGEPELAEEQFRREIEFNPDNAEAHFNLGLFYKLEGTAAEAVAHWEDTIRLNAYFVPAYQQLAEYYRGLGDTDTARAYELRLETITRARR